MATTEAMTRAELWDRRIERAEWLIASALHDLEDIIDYDKAFDLLVRTRDEAVKDAVSVSFEGQIADRVLEFSDRSKLLLIKLDANTAAGDSRVLRPTDRTDTRSQLRNGNEYQHGIDEWAWLAFPPHDSF